MVIKNDSFYHVSADLRARCIKNWDEPIRILDKDLLDIDPRDEKLPAKIRKKVYNEIVNNPFYYLSRILQIRSNGEYVPFKLTRSSYMQIWAMIHGLSTWWVSTRQTGSSTTINAVLSWLMVTKRIGSGNRISFMNKARNNSIQDLHRLQQMIISLPIYILEFAGSMDCSIHNYYAYVNTAFDNLATIITHGAPLNYTSAINTARELTENIQIFSDAEFIPYLPTIIYNNNTVWDKDDNLLRIRTFVSTKKVIEKYEKNAYLSHENPIPEMELYTMNELFYDNNNVKTIKEIIHIIDIPWQFESAPMDERVSFYLRMIKLLNNDPAVVAREIDHRIDFDSLPESVKEKYFDINILAAKEIQKIKDEIHVYIGSGSSNDSVDIQIDTINEIIELSDTTNCDLLNLNTRQFLSHVSDIIN